MTTDRAVKASLAVPVTLQTAVNEIESLALMSYTGWRADLGEDDVRSIRNLLIDLALLLAQTSGQRLPDVEVWL